MTKEEKIATIKLLREARNQHLPLLLVVDDLVARQWISSVGDWDKVGSSGEDLIIERLANEVDFAEPFRHDSAAALVASAVAADPAPHGPPTERRAAPVRTLTSQIHGEVWQKLVDTWTAGTTTLPCDSATRKAIPVHSGCIAYFPAALVCVAVVSKLGNDQHNPGAPLHHDRSKSSDEKDAGMRHLFDQMDEPEQLVHAASRAWRALSDLQKLCESLGAPTAPGARLAPK